jgi:hypothetical protein
MHCESDPDQLGSAAFFSCSLRFQDSHIVTVRIVATTPRDTTTGIL